MNVLYCGDRNIEDGLIISILSLLKNVKDELNIYVLTIDLDTENGKINAVTDKCIYKIEKMIKQTNDKNNMKKIDITRLFEEEMSLVNMKTRFTPCCMLRLFADKITNMPDQSSINKLAINKKILPRKYNEQRKLQQDTVFQHFTTSFRAFPIFHKVTIKPWNIEKLHGKLKIFEYDDIIDEYKKMKEELKEEKGEVLC